MVGEQTISVPGGHRRSSSSRWRELMAVTAPPRRRRGGNGNSETRYDGCRNGVPMSTSYFLAAGVRRISPKNTHGDSLPSFRDSPWSEFSFFGVRALEISTIDAIFRFCFSVLQEFALFVIQGVASRLEIIQPRRGLWCGSSLRSLVRLLTCFLALRTLWT